MQFQCSECGQARQVDDSLAGKRIKCPNCQNVQQVDINQARFKTSAKSTRPSGKPESVKPNLENRQSSGSLSGVQGSSLQGLSALDAAGSSASGSMFGEVETGTSTSSTNFEGGSKAKRPNTPTATRKNRMMSVVDYSINRGALGSTLSYACPYCKEKLTSSLHDAGGADNCPKCRRPFIVPGGAEYQQEMAKKAAEDSARKAQQDLLTEASKKSVVNKVAQAGMKDKHVQLDRDPLKEWLVYTLIMTVLMGFAAGRYMVSAVVHDSSYLCIVIFALFAVGLTLNFRSIMRLRNEYVCAAVCMINLHKIGGMQSVTNGPAAGVLHQHIMDLNAIAQHDENFTQDSLITLLYSRMMSRSKMIDILGGVLVTLGLIGTIVGLIQMTDGLSVTLSSLDAKDQSTDLLTGMRSTMSGLGTAFNTTLVGALLGSVVLRILNNVYTSNVDHLVTYVASTAEVSIVPRLKGQLKSQAKLGAAL